jgi:hypothetical protein
MRCPPSTSASTTASMVFSDNQRADQYCERYSTEAEAIAGHERIVQMVTLYDEGLRPALTVDAVQKRVEEIAAIGTDDPEVAHSKEDDLYKDVLWQIADGTIADYSARQIAAGALKADGLDFERWFA